ncbi:MULTISPECIES: hypothetical protein [unclassified Francisella]|uniref:hypothetical protein n=1 Tax=unclassified Francisella TaxID=2610885 RepID=UPI002E2F2739|nr:MULTISPECIES: hypothetical protein [unclassified Francisella]MED7820202.1 hypothetical protein [Francisella sp. 19S2-4]MED7831038.1 hypothetical protein [Francisella sp. 19S2-10]
MSKSIVTEGMSNVLSIVFNNCIGNLKYKIATLKFDDRLLKEFTNKLIKSPIPSFDIDSFKDYLSNNAISLDDLSSDDVTKLIINYNQDNCKSSTDKNI